MDVLLTEGLKNILTIVLIRYTNRLYKHFKPLISTTNHSFKIDSTKLSYNCTAPIFYCVKLMRYLPTCVLLYERVIERKALNRGIDDGLDFAKETLYNS